MRDITNYESEYKASVVCLYYCSRTFVVLMTCSAICILILYYAQLIYLFEQIPRLIESKSEGFLSVKCDPSSSGSCRSDKNMCDMGYLNTCIGGKRPSYSTVNT